MVVAVRAHRGVGVGSVLAQGDSDSIGCRIVVDDEVKAETDIEPSERLYLLHAEGRMSNTWKDTPRHHS